MAFTINGFNYSYDYSELLFDLREDLEDGIVKEHTIINIVRGEAIDLTDEDVYFPIIDYYLSDDWNIITKPLEETYNIDEYTEEEWQEKEEKREREKAQFLEDKAKFEKTTVSAALTEMENWNSIF